MLFDYYIAVDWSARSKPSSRKPASDALWVGERSLEPGSQKETYFRTRFECVEYLLEVLRNNIIVGFRTFIGYDLDFGFPAGFASAHCLLDGDLPWQRNWTLLVEKIVDDTTNMNNRFEVASTLNALCMDYRQNEIGPLWGCLVGREYSHLQTKKPKFPFEARNGVLLRDKRWTEHRESKAQPVWKLIGSASVGGQTLLGIPAISKLRYHPNLRDFSQIWPFETGFTVPESSSKVPSILHVEIWPGLLNSTLDTSIAIRDKAQVRATVNWLLSHDQRDTLRGLFTPPSWLSREQIRDCVSEEGWVLGSGLSVPKSQQHQSADHPQASLFDL